ncbi:MAG: hypothetical protein IKQ73_06395, partial [Oscillospiraceae bacterium]|nr:hypothetical protein [Oscillospiraceae bacterium]
SYRELTEESSIPFDVQAGENGFRVTLKEGAAVNPASDKYYVKLTVKDPADAGRSDTTKAYTAVSVKMGAAKLTQSTKTVVLLKTDGNSSGAVSIGSGDAGLNGVSRVVFADSMTEVSKDGRFTVENLGGDCIVRYTGGEIPVNLKPAKLKLAVFLEGNDGAKANASLPITVKME